MAHIDATTQNFQQEVIKFQGKVLVDFWAPWCGPCQMLGPVIDEIGDELKGEVKIVKINVDEESDIATEYNVSAIPTVLYFENGTLKETFVGFKQKTEYLNAVKG
jgi:thioredoxin 1